MNIGAVQVIPSVLGDLSELSSAKVVGASGLVKILTPAPIFEKSEFPKLLVASTFATTVDPHGRLNGVLRSSDTGIVQDFDVKISVFDPSQFIRSTEKL